MAARATGARFRQRKLSTKHALSIIREEELLDGFYDEDDPSRQAPNFKTGVEDNELTEHHLQAVISASAVASLGGIVAPSIPTPEVKPSADFKYEDIYPKRFSQPTTYIRFSSTVEDCIGPPYCVDEADEKYIAQVNETASPKDGRMTLDLFEEVMSFFEATAAVRQPFATIDNAPVLSFEELQASYDDNISLEGQKWASVIYSHWSALRLAKLNRPLMASLKFETGAETDDVDAFVCFRRREVRQARKTRGRDAQVVEKLKKLRRELEDARQLVHNINAREKLTLECLAADRAVFDQRQELKRVKVQHGIKGDKGEDEELLINQRPVAKPKMKLDMPSQQHRPSTTLRLSTGGRPDPRGPPEQDLVQLDDVKEEAEALVRKAVEAKILKHREWNRGFVDDTWKPIVPPDEERSRSAHLPAIREVQLPTPPASVEGDSAGDKTDLDASQKRAEDDADKAPKNLPTPPSDDVAATRERRTMYRFEPPTPSAKRTGPTFRRRYGRLGRLHIDAIRPRRILPAERSGVVYDSDDSDLEMGEGDDDDDVIMYPIDYWSQMNVNYRASLMNPPPKRVVDHHGQQVAQQSVSARRSSSSAVSAPQGSDAATTGAKSTALPGSG